VKLFNGEPIIIVRLGRDKIYRWATKKHGAMDAKSLQFVEDYMVRNKHQCKIVNDTRDLEDLV